MENTPSVLLESKDPLCEENDNINDEHLNQKKRRFYSFALGVCAPSTSAYISSIKDRYSLAVCGRLSFKLRIGSQHR